MAGFIPENLHFMMEDTVLEQGAVHLVREDIHDYLDQEQEHVRSHQHGAGVL